MFTQQIGELSQFNTSDSSFLVRPRKILRTAYLNQSHPQPLIKLASKLNSKYSRPSPPSKPWQNSDIKRIPTTMGYEMMMDGGVVIGGDPIPARNFRTIDIKCKINKP